VVLTVQLAVSSSETGKDFESDMKIAGMWLVAAQELLPFSNVFTDGKNAVLHCKRIAEFLTKVQIELDGVSLPRSNCTPLENPRAIIIHLKFSVRSWWPR
jgi:hypothetical protein